MSINIKKYTKEQMAGMVEAAQAANAELERKVAMLGDGIDKQTEALRDYAKKVETLKADNDFLRGKLADTEAALGRANADIAHQIESNRTLTFELHREGERVKALECKLANREEDLKDARMQVLDLGAEVDTAYNHPWKHLWECLKGARND